MSGQDPRTVRRLLERAFFAATAACVTAIALGGCDDKKETTSPALGRSEVVHATGSMQTAATETPSAAAHPSGAPGSGRKLCEGELDKPGRALPAVKFTPAHASDAPLVDAKIPLGAGRWTWINFFAGWCGPCKEEMPRLRAWEKKLEAAGTPMNLAFVSLDDDERELVKFLVSQPSSGVRSSLWLKSGAGREDFLTGLKLKNPPNLPVHVLVDPASKVRCVIDGAVEESDYGSAASIVSKK